MARIDTDIKKVEGVDANYLTPYAEKDHSLDEMDKYRILPRHKVIQGTTLQLLKDEFGEGSIILQPGNVRIWKREDPPFIFVPALFFVEWMKWADLNDGQNSILGRTTDPTHEIAKRAKDPELRFEVYEGQEDRPADDQMKYRYVQTFRFVGIIYDKNHPLNHTLFSLSFERGEFSTGQNLINAIRMRKIPVETSEKDAEGNPIIDNIKVPLYAQMWKVDVSQRTRKDKKWWGVDVRQMEELVPSEDIQEMQDLHLGLKADHDKERLVIEEGAEDADPAAVDAAPF